MEEYQRGEKKDLCNISSRDWHWTLTEELKIWLNYGNVSGKYLLQWQSYISDSAGLKWNHWCLMTQTQVLPVFLRRCDKWPSPRRASSHSTPGFRCMLPAKPVSDWDTVTKPCCGEGLFGALAVHKVRVFPKFVFTSVTDLLSSALNSWSTSVILSSEVSLLNSKHWVWLIKCSIYTAMHNSFIFMISDT